MKHTTDRLAFVGPAWFSVVMGLAGLSLAWHRAAPIMGDVATGASMVLGAAAAAVFVVLAAASLWRLRRHPKAWAEDLRHPMRHPFVAAIPVSLILLATVWVAWNGPDAAGHALWRLGSVAQAGTTLWVLARWWRPAASGGLAWPTVTPVLLIPVVGNVLVPLAGIPLGEWAWSAAQFGVGVLFWPVILGLLVVRIAASGPWPERLRPSALMLIAPPAVIGLALLQFGAPVSLAWGLWGIAAFSGAWTVVLLPRIAAQPFGLPHWTLSFPLAALAALSLRLAPDAGAMGAVAPAILAAASLVACALVLGTLRGLREGSLLAPEPVAVLQSASA